MSGAPAPRSRIPQHFIDELIDRVDIAEVVGERVALRRKGRDQWGCCPFHDENTPSFKVDAAEHFYKCFGCGKGGNVLQFLMDHDRLSFIEAIETLAQRAGMEVPRADGGDPEAERKARQLREIMDRSLEFYSAALLEGPSGRAARDYLRKRGLDGETVRRFSLGYAPDAWDALLKALGTDDATRKLLEEAGLVVHKKDTGRCYDRFRDRVMFPIRNTQGRVIGFGGRCLGDGEPKYLNSPETPLFHKGRELYGLYEARSHSGGLDRLLVVEGYMYVIALAQQGVTGAVATLGTAATEDHLRKLFRVAPEIVFCFDGDEAGRRAAARAMEFAAGQLQDGLQVRFLALPEGEDPDTLVRREGSEAFSRRVAAAEPFTAHLLADKARGADLESVEGRAAYASRVEKLIRTIPGRLIREMAMRELAERTAIDPRVLAGSARPKPDVHEVPEAPPLHAPRRSEAVSMRSLRRRPAAQQAMQLLLWSPGVAADADAAGLDESDTEQQLLGRLIGWLAKNPGQSQGVLLGRAWAISEDQGRLLAELVEAPPLLPETEIRSEFTDILEHLRQRHARRLRDERLRELRDRETLSEPERAELLALLGQGSSPGRDDGTHRAR